MADLWQCTLCDETVEESGRVGHLRFSEGDGHGKHQELPPEYEDDPEPYFVIVDDDGENHGDEPEGNDDSPESTADPDGGDTGNSQPGTGERTGVVAKIKRFLMTDISDL